jgi:hypothetical protein
MKSATPSAVDPRPLRKPGAWRLYRRPLRRRTCSQTRCTTPQSHSNCCVESVPFGLPETVRRSHVTGVARPSDSAAFMRLPRRFRRDLTNCLAGLRQLGSIPHQSERTDSKANVSARVYQLPAARPVLLTKKQLAVHLGRSTRWIEMQMRRGLPVEGATDRFGGRRYDLAKVESWLRAGEPVVRREKSLTERVAALELLVGELTRGAR